MQWLSNLISEMAKADPAKRQIFFDLIHKNKGKISVMDFALAADVSGTIAKKILEQYAVEFDATFEVTEEGHINYIFPVSEQAIAEYLAAEKAKKAQAQIPPQDSSEKTVSNDPVSQSNDSISERINKDMERHKQEIAKVEADLKNLGKSLNDQFKF